MANSFEAFPGEKVAIVHDSAASLPDNYRSGYSGLVEVPFKVSAESHGKTIKEWVDNSNLSDEQMEEFLYYLRHGHLKTSTPNIGDYVDTYQEVIDAGITEIGVVTISNGQDEETKISSSWESAEQAAKQLADKANIVVMDSKTISIGQGLLINQADIENRAGDFNTADELIERVEDLSTGLHLAQAFSDVRHLRRSGRIRNAEGLIGGVLGIIPVLSVDEEGLVKQVNKKERGWAKAHRFMIDYISEGVASHDPEGKLGNVAIRLAFIEFESEKINVLRSKVMELVQSEDDSDKEKAVKFKLANGPDDQTYEITDYKESLVLATHSGFEVNGFGALVISEKT
jgi:DegV family protein with EDD domain